MYHLWILTAAHQPGRRGTSAPLYIKQDFEAQGTEVNCSGQHMAEPGQISTHRKSHLVPFLLSKALSLQGLGCFVV